MAWAWLLVVGLGVGVASADGIDKSGPDVVVKRNLARLRYCYSRELQKHPALAGTVRLRWVVGPGGTVVSAEVRDSTLGAPLVEDCLLRIVRAAAFPAPRGGGIQVISYPLNFRPPPPSPPRPVPVEVPVPVAGPLLYPWPVRSADGPPPASQPSCRDK